MSTFIDPLEPESFEHNGQHPEIDEETDSFDEDLQEKLGEFVAEPEPSDSEAPGA
ncbi:hypothetical protein GCM10010988_33160 [Cnuibacter physcomitrellae]|uniref:hypothetical protein n=1 Tax=Cnuibacter physcomitrellae TaxID=1619308 RepID=UPI0012F51DD5|nr:hypothetical protein [Cnuibacter physcomitrellae]MCS5498963.1 hypothetical protein [Cnuibacter physcomitrellae]GGI41252.1 hypothetical protein GCM10010988_33160 [Cnuibacter physcomitrellae]